MSAIQETTTISVRIGRPMRAKLSRLGIKPSIVIKKALSDAIEREARRAALADLEIRAKKLKPFLDKISDTEVVAAIREARESR